MLREYVYARLVDDGQGVTASIVPADRKANPAPRFGKGDTIEQAIGSAMGRRVRFHTNGDEAQAEIITFRERAISLMVKGDELITLGIR